MEKESIASAITKLTQQVRNGTLSDTNGQSTDDEIATRRAAIEGICDELDALAKHSASPHVRFPSFEFLRRKLDSHHAYPLQEHIKDVATAFYAAGRVDLKA